MMLSGHMSSSLKKSVAFRAIGLRSFGVLSGFMVLRFRGLGLLGVLGFRALGAILV